MQKKQKDEKVRYTYDCEMFSFGMLLWELSFNRIPYKDLEDEEIIEHVMNKKRETLNFGKDPCDIVKGFAEIITLAWQHDHNSRPTNPMVSSIIEPLYKTYFGEGKIENIPIYHNEQNTDEFISDSMLYEGDEQINFNLNLLPLIKGIEYHNTIAKVTKDLKDYRICWECFKAHANMDNKMAIYWKGFYLWEGYVKKNRSKAKELYKIAADAGITIAQYRYAFAFDSKNHNNSDLPYNEIVFWEYLKKAADSNYPAALYHVGDCYYNGKIVSKNENLGIEYFKLAAYQGENSKAFEALQKYNIPF